MENRNSSLANRPALSKQPPLDQLLAVRLELGSKRRQETEMKIRDSDRLLDKMSKMSREQEVREKLILDLRRKVKDESTRECDGGGVGGGQLAVAERTVKLLERDLSDMQEKYTKVKTELQAAGQNLLDKRIELNWLSQTNVELDAKVGKLERKVKDCWAEEDRLLEELHVAGDRISGFEQEELDKGLENFNRIAILEESLRVMAVAGICREIVLEMIIDVVDLGAGRPVWNSGGSLRFGVEDMV